MNNSTAQPAPYAEASTTTNGLPTRTPLNDSPLDWRPGSKPRQKPCARVLNAFLATQQAHLLELRAALVNSLNGIARETRAENGDRLALTTHIGDAGTDAYDRDFALALLSDGTNALVEIDHALSRIDAGTYGFCEMSGRPIPESRLEAIPFARYTVECQSQVEKDRKLPGRFHSSQSPFPFGEEEADENEEL